MPPSETREKPAPEVWLEDSTWIDTRRSRSRDDAPVDPVVITVSTGDPAPDAPPPFYDHASAAVDLVGDTGHDVAPAAGPDSEEDRAAAEWAESDDGVDRRHGTATPTEVAAVRRAADAASSRKPFTPAAPAGEVPGLLRRPLVEIQPTPPRDRDELVDRPHGFRMPDSVAIIAIALALITLLSAIITAQG